MEAEKTVEPHETKVGRGEEKRRGRGYERMWYDNDSALYDENVWNDALLGDWMHISQIDYIEPF